MILLIRYRKEFLTDDEIYSWQWAKVIPKPEDDAIITEYKDISDRTARRMIRLNGLVLRAQDNTMQIWDTPEGDFQKEYAKRIIVKDL